MPTGCRFGFLYDTRAVYQFTYVNMKWHVGHSCGNQHMEWPRKEGLYLAAYRLLEGKCANNDIH